MRLIRFNKITLKAKLHKESLKYLNITDGISLKFLCF